MAEETAKTEKTETTERKGSWLWHLPSWLMLVLVVITTMALFFPPLGPTPKYFRHRMRCKSYLRGLGTAVEFYKADNSELDPISWAEVPEPSRFSPKVLVCPASGTEDSAGPKPGRPPVLEGYVDYILISGFGEDYSGDLVRSFELPANHRQQMVNMLHLNGAVLDTHDLSEFMLNLQKTNDRLAVLRKGL